MEIYLNNAKKNVIAFKYDYDEERVDILFVNGEWMTIDKNVDEKLIEDLRLSVNGEKND